MKTLKDDRVSSFTRCNQHIQLICLSILTALYTLACNRSSNDSVKEADNVNMQRDSNQKTAPLTPDKEISGLDAKFADKAAAGGLAEVELGNLATQKSNTKSIKDLANMMIRDHSQANDKLKLIAMAKHIVLPARIDNDAENLKKNLEAKTGEDFDKAYIKAMVKDHQQDISDFNDAYKIVRYPEIQAYIKNTLPVLTMHLKAAQEINNNIK